MKLIRLFSKLLVAFCLLFYCYSSAALATDTAAPDNPTTTPPYTFDPSDGTVTNPDGGCPTGTSAMIVTEDGTGIRFGECVNTFAISYAINQALQGSGVSIDKVHYKWKYIHCFNTPDEWCSASIENRVNTTTGAVTDDTYWDELVVVIELTDANGDVVKTETWTMDRWYDWQNENAHSFNEEAETYTDENGTHTTYWQIHEDNIELYNHIDKIGTIYTPNALGDIRFRITGYDKGNWDGYFGPIMKDLQTWFTYRANPCNDTALYDPSCPGYAEAYATYEYDTNCSANALYDPGCPGYADAYYNNQCQQDPLYDSECPGYDTAYYNQQCSLDPLYDSGCPGYAGAYFTQQCDADPLYSPECSGYDTAYYNQQCNADPLYDTGCPGYATAYYNYQCEADPLYDSGCSGYDTAYFNQQCTANTLYDSECPGYDTAYLNQQCGLDTLYDSSCPGYEGAYFTQQCEADALYDIRCPGYDIAYFNQQCLQNPQYDAQCIGYVEPVVATPTPSSSVVVEGTGTGDAVVDSVIATPTPVIIIPVVPVAPPVVVAPVSPAPEPEAPIAETPVEVVTIETIEQEVEAEIEAPAPEPEPEPEVQEPEPEPEVVEETIEEPEVEETTDEADEPAEENNNEETTEEESSGDVEQPVDGDETEEKDTDNGGEDDRETSEDTGGDTAQVKEPVVKKQLTAKQKQKAKERKMRKIIKEKLMQLAEVMGKAVSLQEQQALQAQISALINYVPGFNAYGQLAIPGRDFYGPGEFYDKDKKVPENNRGLLNGLASEIKHQKMVDEQYEGMD